MAPSSLPSSNFSLPSSLEPSNVHFFPCCDKIPGKNNLKQKEFPFFGSQFEAQDPGEEGRRKYLKQLLILCLKSGRKQAMHTYCSAPSPLTPDPSEAVTHNGRIFSLNNAIKVIPKGHTAAHFQQIPDSVKMTTLITTLSKVSIIFLILSHFASSVASFLQKDS